MDWGAAAFHAVTPQIADGGALVLTVGIIGATVMPHAVYLHSALTQARTPQRGASETFQILQFSNQEVVVALAVAGLVNMAMVMMASAAFHAGHHLGSKQVSPRLCPRPTTGARFRWHPYAFDTSSAIHFRSSFWLSPDAISSHLFPGRSPPGLLTQAAPGRFGI